MNSKLFFVTKAQSLGIEVDPQWSKGEIKRQIARALEARRLEDAAIPGAFRDPVVGLVHKDEEGKLEIL